MNWFLKKAEGEVYGPVDLDTLRVWATDGRIAPSDLVSADQGSWTPAPSLADLEMDWFLEVAPDEWFGPVNLLAFRDLISAGNVPLHIARALHKITREEQPAAPLLLRAMIDEDARLRAAREQLASRIQDLDHRVRAYETVFAGADPDTRALKGRFQRELKTSLEHRDAYEKEAVRWKRLYDDEREKSMRREAELMDQLRRLRETELASRREIEALAQRIRDIEKGDDFITKVQVISGSDSSAASIDGGSLLASYKTLSRNYDRLVQELSTKAAEIHDLMAARARVEHDAHERVRHLEDSLRREQEEAEAVRKKLIELEEAHLQFVQAYRDLNDRYIRSRQAAVPPLPGSRKEPIPAQPAGPRIRLV